MDPSSSSSFASKETKEYLVDEMGIPNDNAEQYMNQSLQQEYNPAHRRILDRLEEEHALILAEGRLEHYCQTLQDLFIVSSAYKAVSLHSGLGTLPIELANEFPSLEWTPTETSNEGLQRLREALDFFVNTDNDGPVLGGDRNGLALFAKDKVKLEGLSSGEGYNGRKGQVLNVDPKDKERVGVTLETKNDPISLKGINLVRMEEGIDYEQAMQIEKDRTTLQNLLDRSCWIQDATKLPNSHLNQCALVTYSTLNTIRQSSFEEGEKEDEKEENENNYNDKEKVKEEIPWRSVLEIAAQLLAPGGYLLQYDIVVDNDYGEEDLMKDHAQTLRLSLDMEKSLEPIDYQGHGRMKLILWRKMGDPE
jgi:hypothetical protein